MSELTEQQIWNSVFDPTNQNLKVVAATGTKVGSLPDCLISEQNILNSAFDPTSQSLRMLFT